MLYCVTRSGAYEEGSREVTMCEYGKMDDYETCREICILESEPGKAGLVMAGLEMPRLPEPRPATLRSAAGNTISRQKPIQNMVLAPGNRIEPMVPQLSSKAMAIFSMAAMQFMKLVFEPRKAGSEIGMQAAHVLMEQLTYQH